MAKYFLAMGLLVLLLAACGPATPESRNQEIILDQPTNTRLLPTNTLFPTDTLIPTMTYTLQPSFTPRPTYTRILSTATAQKLASTATRPVRKLTPTATIKLKATTAPTKTKAAAATKKPTATKASSAPCVCSRDYDCKDFSTQKAAQTCFNFCGGSKTKNWSNLDADHDGIACESLP